MMQTQEPAKETGETAPAQEQSAAGAAGTLVPATEPLLNYPATILWIGFGGGAFVFLVIFVLLLRGRVGRPRAPAEPKAPRAPKAPKEKRNKQPKAAKKKGKGAPDTEFFQPAGESAEITFDEDQAMALDQGDLAVRNGDAEAEVVIERRAPEAAGAPSRRPGPFAGIFGNNRDQRAAARESAAEPEAPLPARDQTFDERREEAIDVEVHDLKSEDRVPWPAERALSIEEQRRQALADVERARAEADLARAEAENERRRLEDERRNLEAAQDERLYAEEDRRAAAGRAAELSAAVDAQARSLKRDVALELDERFTALADRIEARLKDRDGPRTSTTQADAISALAREIDER
ncbi:MAG: hypothetical protein WD076_09715, partial [Parvularculaceae bacterium]